MSGVFPSKIKKKKTLYEAVWKRVATRRFIGIGLSLSLSLSLKHEMHHSTFNFNPKHNAAFIHELNVWFVNFWKLIVCSFKFVSFKTIRFNLLNL